MHGAGLPLGAVEHRLDRGVASWASRTPPRSASSRRSPTRAEPIIAARSPRKSRGWRTLVDQHLHDVAPQLAALVEPQRRDADALLPDLGGAGVVGAVRGAADVALVRAVDRPEHAACRRRTPARTRSGPAGGCRRDRDRSAGRRRRAGFRPRRIRATARAAQGSAPTWIGTCSACAISRPSRSQIAGREIAARVEDLRIGGAQHRLAHLLDDRVQAMLDDRYGDGIDGGFRAGVHGARSLSFVPGKHGSER